MLTEEVFKHACLKCSIYIYNPLHNVFYFMAGYQKQFTWDTYLVDVANIPAPYELFTSVCFIFKSIYYHIKDVQNFAGLA